MGAFGKVCVTRMDDLSSSYTSFVWLEMSFLNANYCTATPTRICLSDFICKRDQDGIGEGHFPNVPDFCA